MTGIHHKSKYRVHKETQKLRRVTHWDMDYLSLPEIESLYRQNRTDGPPKRFGNRYRGNGGRRPLVLIAVGVALLLLSLTIASRL